MSIANRAPWYGLAFGVVLSAFALESAGVGHGSYLPSMIFAAPLSILPPIGLFAPPPFWAVIGWMLRAQSRRVAILILSVHTAAAALMLLMDMSSTHRLTDLGMLGIVVYALGLMAAWTLAMQRPTGDR
jgi:hypothetical protein